MSNIKGIDGGDYFGTDELLDLAKEQKFTAAVVFGFKEEADGNEIPYSMSSAGFTDASILYLVEAGIRDIKRDLFDDIDVEYL